MDIDPLVSLLRKAERDIFPVWLHRMQVSEYEDRQFLNRDDFHKTYTDIITALEACDGEPGNSLSVRSDGYSQCLLRSLVEKAYRGIDRGPDPGFSLGYLKTMVSCIEDVIAGSSLTHKERIAAVLTLRRVTDSTEMTVITGLESAYTAGNKAGMMKRPLVQTTSEKILNAIFMSVGEGILLVDEDFEIVKANQRSCEIYGLPQQNIIGTDIRSLTVGTGTEVLERFFDQLIEGQRKSAEITCLYVDGKTFPATLTVTRSDLDGKRYWPIIVRDDTDQRALEVQLRQEKQQTEEMNLTLKTVMKSIEQDRKDFEKRTASKIRSSLLPSLKKIEQAAEATIRKSYLALLEEQLVSLTVGFERELDAGLLKLTKTEIEVCRLIQAGCSSKDICEAMKLSFDTVQTHRRNIRRKLGLNGKKLNLHAFLMNRSLL